jgi:hypothetical protein
LQNIPETMLWQSANFVSFAVSIGFVTNETGDTEWKDKKNVTCCEHMKCASQVHSRAVQDVITKSVLRI